MATGIAGSIDARSQGDLVTAQMDAAKVLSQAEASENEAAIYAVFSETAKTNLAAAAVSGLSNESFSGISEGNREEMRKSVGKVWRGQALEETRISMQQAEAALSARMQSKAALLSGMTSALGTLYRANDSYKQYNTGQTRTENIFGKAWFTKRTS